MKMINLSVVGIAIMMSMLCLQSTNVLAAGPTYAPQVEQPSGGSKIGGFFKGLFYGRSSSGRYMGEDAANSRANAKSSGNNLDRLPDENASSVKTASSDPVLPKPLNQEVKSLPKEMPLPAPPEQTTHEIKPTLKKADTPPVIIKPTKEEVLPTEVAKLPVKAETTKPVVENKPAVEQKITPPAPAPAAASGGLPVGSRTDKPGRVKSPYPPYNELDVSGLQSGSLAMDPTTQKVFRLP